MSEGPGLSLLSLKLCPVEQKLSHRVNTGMDSNSEKWKIVKKIYGCARNKSQTVTDLYNTNKHVKCGMGARVVSLQSFTTYLK